MDAWHMVEKFRAEIVDSSSDDESDQSAQTLATTAASMIHEFTSNPGPQHRGSVKGRSKNQSRNRMAGQARLHKDYFHLTNPIFPEKLFRRRYRMSRDMFLVIIRGVRNYDPYFQCRPDATGVLGFTSYQKCSAAIRMLSYGMVVDIFDEYLRMGESTCLESMYRFCRAVIAVFGEYYCREPTVEDTRRLLSINESRGFPGMIGSIDCMHWEWKNYPFGWQEEIKELEAQVLSLKKDLEKRHEGKSALDKMLSVQQSPNDKSGLGFNSNNKNKSKSKSNKKKGQDKVKDPAKLVCFKCKVEGHHVRSCPLKKKKKHLSEKQQGKRPQGQGQAHARPQVEDRPLPKKNQDVVPQDKKSIKKRKGNTCYLCRVKGHFASSCLSGTLSNPIIVDDDYSLGKDKDGNVFAKFVGTQSGLKKRTIWVAKPIVTNFLGPNLVGDQQAQT
ncbi:hypothetical protein QYE76_029396 [Lolium multiflorum]|uniref:CCHC-type domain-containing protein n=1 Tax=Lolium multiflorum TaxID=4521 RepID=A0AAD8QMS4_LOLMU|nr:hypothetical protein QYE76_029396 [Lolium multiflorum]